MLMLLFKPNVLAYSKRISIAHTIYTSNDGILLNPKSHFVWLHFSNYILSLNTDGDHEKYDWTKVRTPV